MLKYTYIHE